MTTMTTMNYTQMGRLLNINTPLGEDVLLLISFTGVEQISGLFSFDLEMSSTSDAIDPTQIVGSNVSIAMRLVDDTFRYFNGFVSRFLYIGSDDRIHHYRARIVPWLWFLTRTTDCRIFQSKTVPQIVEQVFTDLGFTDFDDSGITGSHPALDYCVQYRETDFNFISRLLEQEGIYYFFRHENGKHTLVMADQNDAFQDCPENNVEFTQEADFNHIIAWEHCYEFRSGRYSQTDYNFETPSMNLLTSENTVLKLNGVSQFDLYDFPGAYGKKSDGDALAKVRMEEDEASYDTVVGLSRCRTFYAGGKFTLTKHASNQEVGKTYVVATVEHRAKLAGAYTTGATGGGQVGYQNSFTCIPATATYRPRRTTPKPVVKGVQTAVVVGPAGEEIYTDKYGRVKVQFFWDREGNMDEKSSCWLRVSQTWAGNGWGSMFIPRIGHEVIIDFIEGDPDRPLITGRVYNAEAMPPYPLPDHGTMSTVKSYSSKGGGGFNEIRFEDKKGDEQVFIHGEKNQDIRIKNDCMEWIGNDRHLVVKNNQIEHVVADRDETIDANHHEKIGADRHTNIVGKEAKAVGGTLSLKVTGDVTEVFNGNHSEETTSDYYLKADTIVIEGMTNVTIKVGSSFIAIGADGIKIGTSGTIDLESTGATTVKATAALSLEGMTFDAKGDTTASLQGAAMLTLKGGMVMIN